MKIAGSVALVTGANGGIGREFVSELLKREARKIYVAVRNEKSLADVLRSDDPRLIPLILDVTNQDQVNGAAASAGDISLLINNAGYAGMTGAMSSDALEQGLREMEVNYFGPLRMSRAFAPILARSGGGAIVNVLSFLSLVTLPLLGTYSASKAAALSLTKSLRAELAKQGTTVIASMPVAVDTAMGAWSQQPKVSAFDAASDTLNAVESGELDMHPGEISRNAANLFVADPKAVQARFSALLPN